jgi:hypothetical protein
VFSPVIHLKNRFLDTANWPLRLVLDPSAGLLVPFVYHIVIHNVFQEFTPTVRRPFHLSSRGSKQQFHRYARMWCKNSLAGAIDLFNQLTINSETVL